MYILKFGTNDYFKKGEFIKLAFDNYNEVMLYAKKIIENSYVVQIIKD